MLSILVAIEDPVVRQAVNDILAAEFGKVVAVSTADQASGALDAISFDVLIVSLGNSADSRIIVSAKGVHPAIRTLVLAENDDGATLNADVILPTPIDEKGLSDLLSLVMICKQQTEKALLRSSNRIVH